MDALVAELDDRVDHLLLLGLEDALLAALLDDQAQLLGADPLVGRHVRAEQPADPPRDPREQSDERPEQRPEELHEPGRRHRHALRVGEADLLGHELAEHDREQGQQDRHHDERERVRRGIAEGRRRTGTSREIVDEADRRERRGEEAQEVDPDLDDRQEAARVGLEVLDADRRPLALVDELLDAAAPDRDEGDLGRREDAVEQDEDDDERELEERAGHEDASPAAGSDGALGSEAGGGRVRVRRGFRAGLADARGHADRQLAGRNVLRDDGPGARPGALPDVARRDDHRVDAEEGAVADGRAGACSCRRSWR